MHDTVSSSRSLASLSDGAERLFWRILAQTDAWGRMRGEPVKVRVLCVPMLDWTDAAVGSYLTELQEAKRVQLYEDGEDIVLQVTDFERHQSRPLRNRGDSRFPAPPDATTTNQWTTGGPLVVTTTKDSESESESEKNTLVNEKPLTVIRADEVLNTKIVYEHWRRERGKVSNRYAKISEARRKKIRSRLTEFSVDELCLAVTNVANDPWPDRPSHDDLTVIFRSREQVERFLEMPALGTNGVPAAETPEAFRARIAAIDNRWKEQAHG